MNGGFSFRSPTWLRPVFPLPARASLLRPLSSVILWYRNLNLLSIDYVFRPRLRSRLTQGRSALPWNPQIFGRKDSHLTLATHSGILSSYYSTMTSIFRFFASKIAPLPIITDSRASVPCFSPGHFRRTTSRPVSYYALF